MNPIKIILSSLPEDGSSIILTDELQDIYLEALEQAGLNPRIDEYILDKLLSYLKSVDLISRSKVENESLNVTILSRKI